MRTFLLGFGTAVWVVWLVGCGKSQPPTPPASAGATASQTDAASGPDGSSTESGIVRIAELPADAARDESEDKSDDSAKASEAEPPVAADLGDAPMSAALLADTLPPLIEVAPTRPGREKVPKVAAAPVRTRPNAIAAPASRPTDGPLAVRVNPLRGRADFVAPPRAPGAGNSIRTDESVEPAEPARPPRAAGAKRAVPRMAARPPMPSVPETELPQPSGDAPTAAERPTSVARDSVAAVVARPTPPEAAPSTTGSRPAATPTSGEQVVRVYYGTDRRPKDERPGKLQLAIGWIPGTLAGLAAVLFGCGAYRWPGRRLLLVIASSSTALVGAALILRGPLTTVLPPLGPREIGMQYTGERGRLTVGWCDVSIPPGHDPGELESPSILRLEVRPDPHKHVVLQRVTRVEPDPFFAAIRAQVHQSPRRDLFLFVHGYNVSFEDAARRTAQISHDLHFTGAAIFFSWPSQGQLIKYTVDENNVAWSVPHLKQFLLDVVRRSDAQSVNLIAHSMGNRALAAAIQELELEMRQNKTLFDEVVLAAPDIDADVFKRDVVPALRRSARRATLYASNHDQALLASKVVHGYARAGDSGNGLVVVDGIDTVDVSRADLSLLGHSYYGSSGPILEDLGQLLTESLPPGQRSWLRSAERDGQRYWVFRREAEARRAEPVRR